MTAKMANVVNCPEELARSLVNESVEKGQKVDLFWFHNEKSVGIRRSDGSVELHANFDGIDLHKTVFWGQTPTTYGSIEIDGVRHGGAIYTVSV